MNLLSGGMYSHWGGRESGRAFTYTGMFGCMDEECLEEGLEGMNEEQKDSLEGWYKVGVPKLKLINPSVLQGKVPYCWIFTTSLDFTVQERRFNRERNSVD
jgi:hypothetical protein